jgi:hypothetical protein
MSGRATQFKSVARVGSGSMLLKKHFEGVLNNIDSRRPPNAQVRFKKSSLAIDCCASTPHRRLFQQHRSETVFRRCRLDVRFIRKQTVLADPNLPTLDRMHVTIGSVLSTHGVLGASAKFNGCHGCPRLPIEYCVNSCDRAIATREACVMLSMGPVIEVRV